MEEFHSNWFNKSNGLSKASFRSSDTFFTSQPFDREKWAGSSENVLSFPSELSQRPNLSLYDGDRYAIPNKEEDNFILTPNKADMKFEYNPQENQESGNVDRPIQLDGLFGGNRIRRMEDYRQDYYHIRRSRGVSFLSEQEGVDHEHAKNQEFDFMRYFSNHGNHDIGSPKEQPKTEPDTSFIEEEDHTLNLGAFPIHSTLRDLTHCFQPKDLHQVLLENTENIINVIPAPQNQEAADQKSIRKLEELKSEPRKKRKLNNSKTVIEPKKEEGTKALKPKKSKSLANKSSITASTAESTQPEKSLIQFESPQNQQKMETSPKDENTNPDSIKTEATSSISKDAKLETSLPLVQSKSLEIPSGDSQIKRTDGLGRLFQGFELPAEVEEFIGKSKIFSSLQQFVTKKIGPLTREERQAKVERYLEKRKGRTWCKKINYDCRKKVAEARLRLKGRFVTKAQAFTMLQEEGIKYNPNEITDTEIKDLLERALENKKPKITGSKKAKESKAKKSKAKMESIDQGITQTPSERNDDYTQSITDEGQEEFY